jgi:microcystin-dependent protein
VFFILPSEGSKSGRLFACNFNNLGPVPILADYLPADGRLVQITAYNELFTVIGTLYGGDGRTTFALPDLRAATPNNAQYLVCVSGVFPG